MRLALRKCSTVLMLTGVCGCVALPPRTAMSDTAPPAPAKTPQQAVAAKREIELPGPYAAFDVGGRGRHMVFHFRDAGRVAVLDLVKREIAGAIPDVPGDALVAAGAEKLMLVIPGQRLIQRWNTAPLRREKIAPIGTDDTITTASLGANADGAGPLLLAGRQAYLYDIEAMRTLEMDGRVIGGRGRYGYVLRSSADGQTFGGIVSGIGPVAYELMQIDGIKTTVSSFGSTSYATRYAQPSADGKLVFLLGAEIYTADGLRRVGTEALKGMTCFPTTDARFFLAVRFVPDGNGGSETEICICTAADRQIIHRIRGFREMAPHGNTNSRNSIARRLAAGEMRYHYVPSVNLIVTLPYDNKRVFVRPLDLRAELGAAGGEWVFIVSHPPSRVPAGGEYVYKPELFTNARRTTLQIESGPKGMKVARNGTIRWMANDAPDGEIVDAVVSVKTKDGAEALQSLRIEVESRW